MRRVSRMFNNGNVSRDGSDAGTTPQLQVDTAPHARSRTRRGSSGLLALIRPQRQDVCPETYLEQLTRWEKEAPPAEVDARHRLANSIRSALDEEQAGTPLTSFEVRDDYLTTLPALPAGLTSLSVYGNRLTTLPTLPAGLTSLNVPGDYSNENGKCLNTLPTLPAGLTSLNVFSDCLTTLPTLPAAMTSLNVHGNSLTTLPTLPAGLTSLDVLSCDSLTTLPTLPAGLTSLNVHGNSLTTLPTLPAGLTSLDVHGNSLTTLPTLPAGLTSLYVHGNSLTTLPTLPAGLTSLYVHGNSLTTLPTLPAGLTSLDVLSCDSLTTLPTLPAGLTSLYVLSCDSLTTLPTLPAGLPSLDVLSCDSLTTLPTLPDRLTSLNVDGDGLTTLPTLPAGLTSLDVLGNSLTTLPTLPAGLTSLDVTGNSLTTLPTLPAGLTRLNVTGRRLTILPTLPAGLTRLSLCGQSLTALPRLPASLTHLTLRVSLISNNAPPENLCDGSGDRFLGAVRTWQSANPSLLHGANPGHADVDDEAFPFSDQELAEALQFQLQHDARVPHALPEENLPSTPVQYPAPGAGQSQLPQHLARTGARPRGITGWDAAAVRHAVGDAPNAAEFHAFLDRMCGHGARSAPAEYENSSSRQAFIARVDALLDAMENSSELRSICLTIAQGATASCGDRVGLALNDMETAHINDDARLGRYSNVNLFKLGRGLYRLNVVEELANAAIQRQRAAGQDMDEIEVRLAYQTQLARRLDLPGVSHDMLHLGCAGLAPGELDGAAATVLARENGPGWMEFLVTWQPWQEAMKREYPRDFANLESRIEQIQDAYAVLPDSFTSQQQRSFYAQAETEQASVLLNFTRTNTMNFLNANEHVLQA